MKRLLRHRLAQAGLARLVGYYLWAALRTTRWAIEGKEYLLPHVAGEPAIVAFWHEQVALTPIVPVLSRRLPGAAPSQIYALVSRHRDGQLIGKVLELFGVRLVYGSSSRGGTWALRNLARMLREGGHIVLTPDGPRGPRRQAAPGVAQLAAMSGAPVLPCAAQTTRRKILPTWDRMIFPLPFGRGVIVCLPPIRVARNDLEAGLRAIGLALDEAADRADRLCAG